MEERKNNTGLVILITVLVMLVLGLVGFIVYDKVINKTNEPSTGENNSQNDDKDVVVDYDLSEAKKIVDKYYYNWRGNTTFENMDENDKMVIAYRKLNDSSFQKADCKLLYENSSAVKKYNEWGYYINILENEHICSAESKTISYEDINSIYKSLFTGSMPKKVFGVGYEAIDYNDSENQFVVLDFWGGGDWPENQPRYDVLSAKLINDNKLVVEVGYTVFKPDVENNLFYADFDKNITYNNMDEVEEDFFRKNADKVKVLTFNFVKENNNFVLKNMEA